MKLSKMTSLSSEYTGLAELPMLMKEACLGR